MESKENKIIVILGPTAGGKTSLAAHVAYHINGAILSADSRQLYRGMDIGTGKDLADYVVKGKQIPYYLIDILEAGQKYSVFEYKNAFLQAYQDIAANKLKPVLCGGTGLYIDAVTKGYKLLPVPPNSSLREELEKKSLNELAELLESYKPMHNTSDIDTKKRAIRAIEIADFYKRHPKEDTTFPTFNPLFIGVKYSRENRRKLISQRLHQRLQEGMIEEVERLIEKGISHDVLEYYGLEYKYISLYLKGVMDQATMVEKLNIAIHQFAKRQMTWFRKMEREGCDIKWIAGEMDFEKKVEVALEIIDLKNFNAD